MLEHARSIAVEATAGPIAFSIASLVTDKAQYAHMLATFRAKGFDGPDCEFLYLDNSGTENSLDAYRGLNRLLQEARGRFVILCHQDVLLIEDGRRELEQRLAELESRDARWAVAGNAGACGLGCYALRISDGHVEDERLGELPARVTSLDENFLVLKGSARLGFSVDLEGFHYYGTDLCLIAELHGHTCYVIDFHLRHLSRGNKSPAFYACERAIAAKYAHAFRPRWVQTTCSRVYISGTQTGRRLEGLLRLVKAKLPGKLKRMLSQLIGGPLAGRNAREQVAAGRGMR